MFVRVWIRGLAWSLLLIGALIWSEGAWLQVKAGLSQVLLERAWQRRLADGEAHRPWPWADHWPVARLRVPALDEDLIVLAGDSGNVLAFAPGHAVRSGLGDDARTVVISGHRDTHFRFLEALNPGDAITLETRVGRYRFRVRAAEVVDSRTHRIQITGTGARLILTTCYPFDALRPGGPLRYLVVADPVRLPPPPAA